MAHLVLMPSVSANSTHAIVQEWGKAEGDNVAEGDVLAEIETDKAVIDLTAEQDGVMGKALVDVGISIEVGAPIAIILAVGEGAEAGTALFPEAAALTNEEAAPVQGQGPESTDQEPSDRPGTPRFTGHQRSATNGAANGGATRLFASPIARKLARERGLDVGSLAGSGPGGRIVRQDVEAASDAPTPQDPAPSTAAEPAATNDSNGSARDPPIPAALLPNSRGQVWGPRTPRSRIRVCDAPLLAGSRRAKQRCRTSISPRSAMSTP